MNLNPPHLSYLLFLIFQFPGYVLGQSTIQHLNPGLPMSLENPDIESFHTSIKISGKYTWYFREDGSQKGFFVYEQRFNSPFQWIGYMTKEEVARKKQQIAMQDRMRRGCQPVYPSMMLSIAMDSPGRNRRRRRNQGYEIEEIKTLKLNEPLF